MFITKGIVDLHHGKIRVFSKGEGTGCTFTVDLPMTRKIDPLVVVNRPRNSRDLLVGLLRSSSRVNSRLPTPSPALISLTQHANHHPNTLMALQPMNRRKSGPLVLASPVPLSYHSQGAQSINPNLCSPISQSNRQVKSPDHQAEGAIVRKVMSNGRQSLHELAENDRMVMNATRRASATPSPLLMKHSPDRKSSPTHHSVPGGPLTLIPPPLLGEPTHEAAAAAVVVGSDHAVGPSFHDLRPAATSAVTTLPSPSPSPAPFPSRTAITPNAVKTATVIVAPSLSAVSSPRSQQQSPKEQKPQGSGYLVLVVDDSTMTRKMLMKTLRNEGMTHCIHASNHTYTLNKNYHSTPFQPFHSYGTL